MTPLRWRIALVLALIALSPASPRQQEREEANRNSNGPNLLVPVPPAKEPGLTPPKPPDTKRESSERDKWIYEALRPAVLTQVGLILVAWWAGYIGLLTMRAVRDQAQATNRAATATQDAADATRLGAASATEALNTEWEIERAYIAMSHKDFVIEWGGRDDLGAVLRTDPRSLSIVMNVRNFGKTPGDVLGGFFGFTIRPESDGPGIPSVTDGMRLTGGFFLLSYPEGFVDFGLDKILSQGTGPETLRRLVEGEGDKLLWFVGELDYMDRFGNLHKCGYGRRFNRYGKNLVIDHTTTALNFDRPMTAEEAKQYPDAKKSHQSDS